MNTLTAIYGVKQTDYLCKAAAKYLNDNKSVIYISTPAAMVSYTKGCISSKLKPDCNANLLIVDEHTDPYVVFRDAKNVYNNIHFGCMIIDVYETFDNLSRGNYGLSRIKQSLIDISELGKNNNVDIYIRSPCGEIEDIAEFIRPNVNILLHITETDLTFNHHKVLVEEVKNHTGIKDLQLVDLK